MTRCFVDRSPSRARGIERRRGLSSGVDPPVTIKADRGPSRTELAVKRITGVLALAVGFGLLAPLAFLVFRDELDSVGTIVIAVLSGVTIVAGAVLLLGQRADGGRD